MMEGAKTASDANDLIGNVAAGNTQCVYSDVEDLVKGIKNIVDVVLGEKEGDAEAGDNKKA